LREASRPSSHAPLSFDYHPSFIANHWMPLLSPWIKIEALALTTCFNADTKSRLRKSNTPLVGFSSEIYHPTRLIELRVTMGELGRNKTVLMEFAIVKYRSPYNVILRRTWMRSLRAVGSTIHSMIKFPTNNEVATMKTSREAL
ncbi:hypothetical protein Tco_0957078, partial [Tanacetum coccineum]